MCPQRAPASRGHKANRGTRTRAQRGNAASGVRALPGPDQAQNIRRAEAIVSSAPQPTKILPISEVLSQVELSEALALLPTVAAGAGAAAAMATGGGAAAAGARSASLGWLAAVPITGGGPNTACGEFSVRSDATGLPLA